MRDGFFDTIISALPTIGKIIGGLLTGMDNADMGYMGFLGKTNTDLDQATFTTENGRIYLYNTDTNSNSAVAFSTDTVNGVSDTAIIPGFHKLDMTGVFEQAAANGNENVALSATNQMQDKGIVILTSGKGVSFKEESFSLGNFLKVETKRSEDSLALKFYSSIPNYILEDIISLNITGTNYEYNALCPLYTGNPKLDMAIEIDPKINPYGVYDLKVQAKIKQNGNLLKDSRLEPITENDIQKLIMKKKNRKAHNGR